MAEGGHSFENQGYEPEIDLPDEDNDDDEQNLNETTPFIPGGSSTSGLPGDEMEMQTRQHEQSGLPQTSYAETSFGAQTRSEQAWVAAKALFPEMSSSELEVFYDTKGKLQVKMFGAGKKAYDMFSSRRGSGEEQQLNPRLTKEIKTALGPNAESLIAQDNKIIKESLKRLREAEEQQKKAERINAQKEKELQKAQKLRNKIEQTKARIGQLGSKPENEAELRRLKQLNKNYTTDLENTKKEIAALEKQAKDKEKERAKIYKLQGDLDLKTIERNAREESLQSAKSYDEIKRDMIKNEIANKEVLQLEDKDIINDPDTSPKEREGLVARVAERQAEIDTLRTQIEEGERAMPLRERVKEIFKKYGVTVTAIVLAAGVTIGAVIGAITNALKSMGKALGNGLKTIGQKTASIIPGLIGSIASFLFKAAGQVVGFLAEHTWLLILAVVAILVEGYIKKQR